MTLSDTVHLNAEKTGKKDRVDEVIENCEAEMVPRALLTRPGREPRRGRPR